MPRALLFSKRAIHGACYGFDGGELDVGVDGGIFTSLSQDGVVTSWLCYVKRILLYLWNRNVGKFKWNFYSRKLRWNFPCHPNWTIRFHVLSWNNCDSVGEVN